VDDTSVEVSQMFSVDELGKRYMNKEVREMLQTEVQLVKARH
jgi:hypothetical protein